MFNVFFKPSRKDTFVVTQIFNPLAPTKPLQNFKPNDYCLLPKVSKKSDLLRDNFKLVATQTPLTVLKKRFRKKARLRTRRLREDAIFRQVLLRWVTHWLGSSATLIIDRSLHFRLSVLQLTALAFLDFRISQYVSNGDITRLGIWTAGPNLVLMSSLTRDPELLISWLRIKLPRMTLFAHRRFFRLLGVLLTTLTAGRHSTMAGVNMYLVGKISVTGNAMSRSQLTKNGVGGNSNLRAQVVSGFTLVHTNTGCLGLTLSYFYNK